MSWLARCAVSTVLVVLGVGAGQFNSLLAEESAREPARPETAEQAVEKDWSLSLDLTYNSKYILRGNAVTDDPVFQPSIGFSYKGLTLSVWANMDTTDINDFDNQVNELGYTLDYSFSVKSLEFSVGAIYYQFPQAQAFSTTEVYGAVGLNVPLSPKVTVYTDVDEAHGAYLSVSFGHTFEDVWKAAEDVSMAVALSTSFNWGDRDYNAFYYGVPSGAWTDATVSLGLPFAIGDHLTITPAVNYSATLDDSIAEAVGSDDHWWAGISFAFVF